jgi:hypothetical protein
MASSGMLRRVALVRTDVSSASFIRVTRIGELGTTQAATSNRRTMRRNTTWYFFASCCYFIALKIDIVLTRIELHPEISTRGHALLSSVAVTA